MLYTCVQSGSKANSCGLYYRELLDDHRHIAMTHAIPHMLLLSKLVLLLGSFEWA